MVKKEGKKVSLAGTITPFSKIPVGKALIEVDKLDELMEDKKRIRVLINDTFLDDGLKSLLKTHYFERHDQEVKKLFNPRIGGPLVSLTNKARLAYALGLIDKTILKDLEYIHNIRNKFAHSIKINFTNPEVTKLVSKLSTAKGHKDMAKNSHIIYKEATGKCVAYFIDAYEQRKKEQKITKVKKDKS